MEKSTDGYKKTDVLEFPEGLIVKEKIFPVVFVKTGKMDITEQNTQKRINEAIYRALHHVHPHPVSGQTLLKVHIGETKRNTRMKPEYVESSVHFLKDAGALAVVAGDTTVAYSGPRGHRQNPPDDTSPYLELARRHGWSADGPVGVPFVVLDRPSSAVSGKFEFAEEERCIEVPGIQRFEDFFLAGGFMAADFVINHAHLTLHGLAGLAGCVKSIAMGCSALKGKLRMHQSLLPYFDAELCASCGQCVESCPEDALKLNDENACPVVDPELCIGCGECEAVCPEGAVTVQGEDIADWQRGQDSLPLRMADYTMGLMHGRWEKTIHVLHMYTVTEQCDCVNIRQEPMLRRNLGFLIGKNPFAIDRLAGKMLADALHEEGREVDNLVPKTAKRTAAYVEEAYGILYRESLKNEIVE